MTGILIFIAVVLAVGLGGCALALGAGSRAEVRTEPGRAISVEITTDASTGEAAIKKPSDRSPDRPAPR
jgi:hypothetical protein